MQCDRNRALYFFFIGNKAILTHGFTKKSQKTPKSELDLAKKYRADYKRRHYYEQF
ncbi:MAG: type II toxin-antitoxin system RelE/ParE family toxin [Lachnospiraceae bacterium]|nr:type II toxin-antitoxin system RelE/ParE family toxin [Lachnospiraceae bacterium]